MASPAPPGLHASRPHLFLSISFVLYKSFLLLVAAGTLGFNDYDTSTDLFLTLANNGTAPSPGLASKLLRWDAIYFMHVAKEGYVFEQEWAFGIGFSTAVRWGVRLVRMLGLQMSETVMGIAVAHGAHLAAVLALYQLALTLQSPLSSPSPAEVSRLRARAVVPALLHIISPAGIFLSAPYAESSFAALSFFGILLMAHAARHPTASLLRGASFVLAGATFGLSATFRSNGLLSGLPFLIEAISGVVDWWKDGRPLLSKRILDVAAVCLGGLGVAVGFVGPQALAWMRYCAGQEAGVRRAWCDDIPPSIYTHVQSLYWNVGFLRYWTPNQIPLFLLAGPMLVLLIASGISTLQAPNSSLQLVLSAPTSSPDTKQNPSMQATAQIEAKEAVTRSRRLAQTLAATQTLLAVLAFTSYHVQIVNRISSGYPVWYWWVGACFASKDATKKTVGRIVVIGAIVYGALQAALFASFMPPA